MHSPLFWIVTSLTLVFSGSVFYLGLFMWRIRSLKQELDRYERDRNYRPFIYTVIFWWHFDFRRTMSRQAVETFGDRKMTIFLRACGLVFMAVSIFSVAMMIGIIFFDL